MTRPSVWEDRNPRTPAPAAEVEGAVDVVVIGGGLTGLTTALLLGRAGRRVVVLEADRVGAGTTGRSTAKVSLLQGTRLSQISSKHPVSVVRDYVDGNREAQAWVERFCEEHGVGLQHRAAYTYAHGGRGERQVRQEHEAAQRAGLATEWVDELGLPYPTRGAVRLADQVQLDPLELVHALAREAEGHGVSVVEGTRALEVSGSGPYRVVTEQGSVAAGTVVVATNMPMLDRGGFFARMKPARSYGLTFRTPEPPIDGMYLSADQPSRSLRDVPDGPDGPLLMVGGNGHPTGRGGSTEQRLDELRAWTAEHWPGAVETHAWSAQDFMPHHELPFAGPLVPGNDHLLMAGGYSKWGMTNAVAASLALSGRVLGGHLEWADAWRTWRPREVRGLAKAAMVNAEVGWHLTQGWVKPLLPGRTAPEEGEGVVHGEGVLRRPVAVSRTGGQERTVSAVCTHLGGIVAWNDAERSWDCPLHGSRFDADGSVLDAPATCGLARRSER